MPDNGVEILLVEDNPFDVRLTLHAFAQHRLSHRMHVVRDGAEALDFLYCTGAYASRNPLTTPRLILLDLKLPKIDGLEVLRRIKSDPDKQMLPIVVLTSSSEERDVAESYRLGVNSYICKPIDFEEFSDALYRLGFYWLRLNRLPQLV